VERQRPRRKLGRGLSDVSHIFLSGAEQVRAGGGVEESRGEEGGEYKEPSFWLPEATYISVTSGESVRGKSTLCANLAFNLRSRGYRIALVNADSEQPDLLTITGCSGAAGDLPVTNEAYGGMPVVTIYGGTARPHESSLDLVEPLAAAARESRLVLIDTAPLADASYRIWKHSDLVIVLTGPTVEPMRSSYVTIKRVRAAAPLARVGLVVNEASSYAEGEQCYRKISGVSRDFLKINIRNYGIIIRDQAVQKAGEKRVPLLTAFPDSKASDCVESITRLILMDESAIARRRTEVRPEGCALRKGA
jgi:flagellar biosynthesis protein FlhG